MKTHILIAISIALTGRLATAESFNSINSAGSITAQTGNIVANGSNNYIYAANGSVQAALFMATSGYITAAGYISSSAYVTAPQIYSNGFLRIGAGSSASAGSVSAVIGQAAVTTTYSGLAVGKYNINKAKDGTTAPSSTTWNDNDPLLEVGNGNGTVGDPNRYRNAFTIYKDGTITMSKAQGDILAGQFGN